MKFLLYFCFLVSNFDVLFDAVEADSPVDVNCHRVLFKVNTYLGSKTPYRFIANSCDEIIQFDGCHPDKIIGFIRHGTRTPSSKITYRMRHDLPSIRNEIISAWSKNSDKSELLCPEEISELASWEFTDYNKGEKWLTHEGEDEMIDLAERLQKRFPHLLHQKYSNSTYYFKHTASQRAEESAKYFTIGLFGRYQSNSIQFPESLINDPILRFYKLCDKWKKTVKKNPRALINHFEYITGDEMSETCEQVSKRLGLSYTLPFEDIHLLYSACSFETAWNKRKNSPWCSVFTENDFEVLQYSDDLKHYWRDGYGHELNYKIACPAFQHVVSFIESSEHENASVVFYFTHSGTIVKLLSHLGLYKDPYVLTNTLTKIDRAGRKFKTSYIDAFASNLIFISFRCGNEIKVLSLHQERAVQIPGCPNNGLCPLSAIQNIFNDTLNNCDFDQLCSLS